MKKIFSYCFALILSGNLAFGQGQDSTYHLNFQDSVRVVLENTKGIEASTIASAFTSHWPSLSPNQQSMIRTQNLLMKKKGYRLKPQIINYYGALINIINSGDPILLDNFLRVSRKVLAKELPAKGNEYLVSCRLLVEEHLLASNKTYRLRVLDEKYRLDYIDPPKAFDPLTDTIPVVVPEPDTTLANLPSYMQPVQQPIITGPVLFFDQATFNFATQNDSLFLSNTKGTLSLMDHIFVGNGGRIDWTMAGLGQDSVFYDLANFNFNVSKPILKAGQGKLTYVGKFEGTVLGAFEFKSVAHKSPKASTYPRFASYTSDVRVSFGTDKIEYMGGFALTGSKISSASISAGWSKINVKGDSSDLFSAQARNFEFGDSVITAKQAKVTVRMQSDSVYHPSIYFSYDYGKNKMSLATEQGAMKHSPFSASLFKSDFNADQLRWDLKSDSINIFNFGNGKTAPLIIESTDFFDPEDYRILRGQGFRFHPLALVANYAIKIGSQDFAVYDLVGKYTLDEIQSAMGFLAQKGMIEFDARSGKIHVKDKAIHMVESVQEKSDYDDLKIHSLIDGTANATINLKKNYLKVRGVEDFIISDSLHIEIKPDSSEIKILKDRDIEFDGKIKAGSFEIIGQKFTFRYDSFLIDLRKIDSIRFFLKEKNGARSKVKNTIVESDSSSIASSGTQNLKGSSGKLYINLPNNKSGKKKIPNYPTMNASAGGTVYFRQPDAIAKKSNVKTADQNKDLFFVAPPFKIDSLNNVDSRTVKFDGAFVSGGIFPKFDEKLHTMKDKSLGFDHTIPQSGYQLYNGQGKASGLITLDNAGLRSSGKIDYLASTIESDKFKYYKDSVSATGKKGEIRNLLIGNVSFPQVTFPDFKMSWIPKKDSLTLKNLKDPFSLYKGIAQLSGSLTVTKSGVLGSGKLITPGTESISKEMTIAGDQFSARHSHFVVKSDNPLKPALEGDDIRLVFNLDKSYADISPEVEGDAAIDFPFAQFKTSIPQARWDLKSQKIVMNKAADVPIENSYFYTTRKDLDSLRFSAEKAEYDIKKQELKVSGIPFIIVADAKITPENNQVLILENAKIGQLKNTTIVLDTLNGYHRLTKGVVDIISRKEFTGYASYQYVNAANDTFSIKMTNFHLEPIEVQEKTTKKKNVSIVIPTQTVAIGAVEEKDKFHLAPRILYKGDMTMYATKPALQLTGFIKLDLKKVKGHDLWLKYQNSGDQKEIILDFDNALTEDGKKPDAGLHFSSDNKLYISFVSDKKAEEDEDFFLASGSLFFDHEKNEFKIEDEEKAAGNKLSGLVFSYNEDTQDVRFEGPVNFFKSSGSFKIFSTVLGTGNLETNDIKMNTFLMADMSIPVTAYQKMATSLQEVIKTEGVAEGLGDQTELLYKIADLVGEKTAKDYEQKSLQNYVSLGTLAALAKPIVFSNVNLKWSQKQKSFYSEGSIGISNIFKSDINGAFEGFMELKKDEGGNAIFHTFFKASPEVWYYFGYEDNRLMIHSSDDEFNQIIAKKTNAAKAKVGELVFVPGSNDETLSFINRFRQSYYGVEVPYDLSSGTSAAKKSDKKKEEKKEDDGF